MKSKSGFTLASLALCGLAVAQTPLPNPSLTPPGAPADGVFKTLDQVEARTPINAQNTPGDATSVFRITAPGSYFLTANIQGASGKSGVVIEVSNVTLDLAGFAVVGVAGSTSGIQFGATGARGVRVFGGTVDSWVIGIRGDEWIIENVHARNNTQIGISSTGTVINCVAEANGTAGAPFTGGILAARAVNCVAVNNKHFGFYGGEGSHFTGCTADSNSDFGYIVSIRTVALDCVARSNGAGGFMVGRECSLRRCASLLHSGGPGILIENFASNSLIEGCHSSLNAAGIKVNSGGNTVIKNVCIDNSGAAGDRDYDIVAGNIVGSIIKQTTAAAIQGNAGGGTGAADPFANIAD